MKKNILDKLNSYTKPKKKKTNKMGYVIINNSSYWALEHRLIVEDKIKRLLRPEECIHHIDGNKLNNSIDNLMLFKSQADHKAFENKIKQFGLTNPIKLQIKNRWKDYEKILYPM